MNILNAIKAAKAGKVIKRPNGRDLFWHDGEQRFKVVKEDGEEVNVAFFKVESVEATDWTAS